MESENMENQLPRLIPVESKTSFLKLINTFGSDPPLKRIFQIVLTQDCKRILVEENYENKEYRAEYESFYKHIFKPPPDKTKRLHFFSCDLKEEDLPKLSEFQDDYLGFCVLRPFEKQKVVSAIIKPIEDLNLHKRWFILCVEEFQVEIKISESNVQKLTAKGFPFMQQDGQIGRCAHVSLATIDRFLSLRAKKSPRLLSDIVEIVADVTEIESEVPGPGLSPYQISRALKKMGYKPVIYCYRKDIKSRFNAARVLYHYMESKIPIMLGIRTKIGWHALTVIGHAFEPDIWWALAKGEYYGWLPSGVQYHCSTSWMDNIIINDDNLGPYMSLPKWLISISEQESELLVVIPLPSDVNVQGEDVEAKAYQMTHDKNALEFMKRMMHLDTLGLETNKWCDIFLKHANNKELVLRTCLVNSEDFKETYPPGALRDFYQRVDMPAKIWLTEVSIPELFSMLRLRMGEIITDSTRSVKFGDTFIVLHLPGIVITRDAQSGQRSYHHVFNDKPIRHILR